MEYLKYQDEVNASFDRLGFTPRPGQAEAVCQVIYAFIDEKMKNVLLCAPTGTGKSIIGAATAETLSALKGNSSGIKSSISLVSTNVLSKQYDSTFNKLARGGKYIMLKGANNYDCSVLTTPESVENAEACAWYTMVQAGSEFDSVIQEHCNKCEYLSTKKMKNTTRHVTTNYSYFFIDRMYTGKFEDRDLIVWDEAHLVNDLFAEHNAIYFSQKRVQAMSAEIAETIQLTDLEIAKILKSVASDCGKKGKITEKNYEAYLRAMQKVYQFAKVAGTTAAEKALRSNQLGKYTKLTRFTKKYEGLSCKIDDLFKYDYDHVFEFNEEEKAVSVKPIFVGTMFEALQCSKHNLFMSATLSPEFMTKTLGLNESDTRFIKLPPHFPKENKEVIVYKPISLSYVSLQNPDTVKLLGNNVVTIVKKHVDDGQRGIILTPSFKLQREIVDRLLDQQWTHKYTMFEQRQGEKLEPILSAFREHNDGPALLISPSLFEGIDLPGDLSRYQIIVKAPFPSLGDKRMKWIMDHQPSLYSLTTLMKAVQGAGRSVRSMNDHATTYILDQNLSRLWTSKQNIWSNEFQTRFTTFI